MRLPALLFTTAVLGCGIPDDMLMSDLTEQEVETLCGELSGDPREVTCSGDGYEITVEIGVHIPWRYACVRRTHIEIGVHVPWRYACVGRPAVCVTVTPAAADLDSREGGAPARLKCA